MAEELSQAALVVLLSEYETHPIAVLEAVALGRPALVAATSGLSESSGTRVGQGHSLKQYTQADRGCGAATAPPTAGAAAHQPAYLG